RRRSSLSAFLCAARRSNPVFGDSILRLITWPVTGTAQRVQGKGWASKTRSTLHSVRTEYTKVLAARRQGKRQDVQFEKVMCGGCVTLGKAPQEGSSQLTQPMPHAARELICKALVFLPSLFCAGLFFAIRLVNSKPAPYSPAPSASIWLREWNNLDEARSSIPCLAAGVCLFAVGVAVRLPLTQAGAVARGEARQDAEGTSAGYARQ